MKYCESKSYSSPQNFVIVIAVLTHMDNDNNKTMLPYMLFFWTIISGKKVFFNHTTLSPNLESEHGCKYFVSDF